MSKATETAANKKHALVIVDVQNDFCDGGALAVPAGSEVVGMINKLRHAHSWDVVALTQDWHPSGHVSFASSHDGAKLFEKKTLPDGIEQVMWPDHCVQGSKGAEFHAGLERDASDVVVQKGTKKHVDSYSGFFDNDGKSQTELADELRKRGVTDVWVCGLATDYCVAYTARDASKVGFTTVLIDDASRGIAQDTIAAAHKLLKSEGIRIVGVDAVSLK